MFYFDAANDILQNNDGVINNYPHRQCRRATSCCSVKPIHLSRVNVVMMDVESQEAITTERKFLKNQHNEARQEAAPEQMLFQAVIDVDETD